MDANAPTLELDDAKRLIADYLTGAYVAGDQLEAACRMANSDRGYVVALKSAVGLLGDQPSFCALFRSRLAEFSAMTADERANEMPEFLDHLDVCRPCRCAFWDLNPLWRIGIADAAGVAAIVKDLGEPIHLTVSHWGSVERGAGPLSVESTTVASAAGYRRVGTRGLPQGEAPLPDAKRRRQWRFIDPDADGSVCVEVAALQPGEVNVNVRFEPVGEPMLDQHGFWITVRNVERAATRLSGPLDQFLLDGFILEEGLWSIRLRAQSEAGRTLNWNIPLVIQRG